MKMKYLLKNIKGYNQLKKYSFKTKKGLPPRATKWREWRSSNVLRTVGVHFECGILKYGLSQVGLGGSALVKAWTNGGMDSRRGVQ